MDLVGPLPRNKRGNHFVLTIVDCATCYPEALALPSTEASRIARSWLLCSHVWEFWRRYWATNFMSDLLKELYQLLHIQWIHTTPHYSQTDGLVERFNSTLKSEQWAERLQRVPAITALCISWSPPKNPQASLPLSCSMERRVRGPLDVLRESWTGESNDQETAVVQVVEMREKLKEVMDLVQVNMERAQERQKQLHDRGTRPCSFAAGEQVLVHLPN